MTTKRLNVRNILKVADAIEKAARLDAKPKIGFNMSAFVSYEGYYVDKTGHKCSATGCIGGWALLVRDGKVPQAGCESEAAKFLGLDDLDAHALFFPCGARSSEDGWDASPKRAAAVLRHLAKTGQVRWDV